MLDLSMAAEALHAQRCESTIPCRETVDGAHRGAPFHVRSEYRKNAPDPITVELRRALDLPLEVVFARETLSQHRARSIGVSVEVRTGDDEFDREIDILSEDDRFARLLSSASRPLRDRILDLLRGMPDARFTVGPEGLRILSHTESEFQSESQEEWRLLFDTLLEIESIVLGVIAEFARDPEARRAFPSRFDLFRTRIARKGLFATTIVLAFAGVSTLILSLVTTTLDASPISGVSGVFVCLGAVLMWAILNLWLLAGRSWSLHDLGWNLTFGTVGLLGVLLSGPAVYNAWGYSPSAEEIWDVGVASQYVAPGKRRGRGTAHVVVAIDRPDCHATCDLIPDPFLPPPLVSGGRVKIAVRRGALDMRWIVGLR